MNHETIIADINGSASATKMIGRTYPINRSQICRLIHISVNDATELKPRIGIDCIGPNVPHPTTPHQEDTGTL